MRLTCASNTGQLLTSLAEVISSEVDVVTAEPLHLFQEALEFFQRCLSLQEYQLTQSEGDDNVSEDGVPESNQPTGEPPHEDHWATVVEPVTRNTILDTLLAQVDTLIAVCGLSSTRGVNDPGWVEEHYENLLHGRILLASEETSRQRDAALAKAKLRCALADAGFNTGKLDLPTYEFEVSSVFEGFSDLQSDAQALCDRADADLIFNASIRKALEHPDKGITPQDIAKSNVMRWKHLTKALDSFTTASKLPDVKHLPRIHLLRGDCEMHRRSLGAAPPAYEIALTSASTLLKNAEIFYRGAARFAEAENEVEEEREASTKEAIVAGLLGDLSRLKGQAKSEQARVREVVEDMREEGLLLTVDLRSLGM
ncbi:MAG: hypothetical protein LQ346_003258 [Caloplaca aetnensis]|nr:MAG: hypothetical protein LQ346_003258 [Caloplaca aetnensis]